jgi:hypothetical protein
MYFFFFTSFRKRKLADCGMSKRKETKMSLSDEELIEANIPRRFWGFSRDDYFGEADAIDCAEDYIMKAKKAYARGLGILFRGTPDTGKTSLITYVLRCLMVQKFTCFYTTLDDLTEWVMRPDSTERFSAKFIQADFVGLDAVNTSNPGTTAAFNKFVRLRVDNEMPILAATSITGDQPDLFGEEGDPFVTAFKESALKLVNVTLSVHCKVNPMRVQRHYDKLKKGFWE